MLINWVLFPVPRIYHVVVMLLSLSCFDITMQRGCNILISYLVLDSENAISRASFVQVPSYRSARRQMNHVFCSVRLISPIFASNCLKLNFKLFFLTDVSNYCEERKIKLSVNVYIKIARNLGSNF